MTDTQKQILVWFIDGNSSAHALTVFEQAETSVVMSLIDEWMHTQHHEGILIECPTEQTSLRINIEKYKNTDFAFGVSLELHHQSQIVVKSFRIRSNSVSNQHWKTNLKCIGDTVYSYLADTLREQDDLSEKSALMSFHEMYLEGIGRAHV